MIKSETLSAFLSDKVIEHKILGPANSVLDVAPLDHCGPGDLTWSRSATIDLSLIEAPIVLLPNFGESNASEPGAKTLFFVDSPRDVFREILVGLFADKVDAAYGFADLNLFKNQTGGRFGHGAIVAENAEVGRNVILHPGAVIYPNVKLGDNVEIGAGTIVGAPGYGYIRQVDGSLSHFPHVGGVVIEDDVTIGANSCVDGGGLSPTRIGQGTKVGNLCQIAHNVEIGRFCLLAGRVQIGGGTKVGDRTEIWPSTVVSHKLVIGANCDIKLGSVVVTNAESGSVLSGNFAVPHEKTLREFARKRLK